MSTNLGPPRERPIVDVSFRNSLRSLARDPSASSDLIIDSQGQKLKAHRLVVQLHSEYFKDMLQNPESQASKEGVLKIQGDHSMAVNLMYQYFYTFEYVLEGLFAASSHEVHDVPMEIPRTTYGIAAMVWVIAHKYKVVGLKRYAEPQFETSAKRALAHHEVQYKVFPGGQKLGQLPTPVEHMDSFLQVISYVYKHPSSTEMCLRQNIINVWSGLSKEVKHLAWKTMRMPKLMKEHPEFGADLIVGMRGGGSSLLGLDDV